MGTRDSGATRRRRPPRALVAGAVAGTTALLLTGCSTADLRRGFLPEDSVGATNFTDRIQTLWNGSWIAALAVGLLVWGLTLWCVVAYRRRKGDPTLPAQVRYNMPIEILYTIVPVMMVGVLFYYTARDQAAILDTNDDPDVTVQVVGKKWSWDFNYLGPDGEPVAYDTGRQADFTGVPGPSGENPEQAEDLPVLYLPVDESVRFELFSRDVAHSFWVPAFLFKMDLIPGMPNRFQVTPTKEGTFAGRCAELCGEYHSGMLFTVEVVSRAEYDDHIRDLVARGQTGGLPTELAGENERGGGTLVSGDVSGRGAND